MRRVRNALMAAATAAGLGSAAAMADPTVAQVPELGNYQLAYSLDLVNNPNYSGGANVPNYAVNNTGGIAPGSFGRVAYWLELDSPTAGSQYVWTSADRLTAYASKTGVPYVGSGAHYVRNIDNASVFSNVAGVATGTNLSGLSVEFHPYNYTSATTTRGPANGSGTLLDWNDTPGAGGYGSMQIHNAAAATPHTVMAFNRWGASATANSDIGIGNNTVTPATGGLQPDWTFRGNAADYTVKKLQVYVGGTAPVGPTVGTGAPAQVYANAPEAANMRLVQTLNVPTNQYATNYRGAAYSVDNSGKIQPGSFDRVGYYVELSNGTTSQWVYVSADAFTSDPEKVGVPIAASQAIFQQNLSRMNVRSNVAGIVTGDGIATGNIEFWPSNYNQAVAGASPSNASGTAFDFGDSQATLVPGHGSMQIHNYDIDGTAGPGTAGQTLYAYNDWGGNTSTDGVEIGIGNSTVPGNLDWTLQNTGGNWTTKNIYVFVNQVPEPGSAALLAAAAGGLLLRRRRRRV